VTTKGSPRLPFVAESRKRVLLIAASILAARQHSVEQLSQIAEPQSVHLATAVLSHGTPLSLSLDTYSI